MVYTPYVVVSGFMSGIGVIIMMIEVLPFLGAPPAPGGFTGAVLALPEALAGFNADAFGVAAATLAAFVFWPRRFARFLPAPLVGLAVGALLGVMWLNGAPTIGRMPAGLPGLELGLPSAGFLAGARTAGDRSRPAGLHRQPPGRSGGRLADRLAPQSEP